MNPDFRKFATQKVGINSMVFDDVVAVQNQYLNPYILEERQLNVTQMDVFSRLMMDRIIFLGTPIDDTTANVLQAQLLYLDSVDSGKDISISASMTQCNSFKVRSKLFVQAWPLPWPPSSSWPAPKASVRLCPTAAS